MIMNEQDWIVGFLVKFCMRPGERDEQWEVECGGGHGGDVGGRGGGVGL
jgi:hypothetical protein